MASTSPPAMGSALSLGVLASGCSPLHPEERVAITVFQELGADIELTQDGRAIAIDLRRREPRWLNSPATVGTALKRQPFPMEASPRAWRRGGAET